MDYSRILVIAPYSELAEEAGKTVAELKKPCRVIVADMGDGAAAAKKALNEGCSKVRAGGRALQLNTRCILKHISL
ncbi:hypothetical protein REC12_01280 [Desulfosporosinus sp. PR]|uniref:hypothetical protein n=1 Tax=Candidatus Desulfosporosinus nitrosoreducens TaxID=3401928 RepID=UPI0027FD8438|nr:hypothetical protein [Desulfosporosinus sp. PR]MDQ7092222.1 hypothetical protein [Desulfosporosinus sp. PR]